MVTAARETLSDAPTSLPTALESTRPAEPPAEALAPGEAPAPEQANAPSRRSSLRFVLVLGALTAIGPLTIDTYLPALPSISRDLAASESAVQATLTGILLGMGLGQLLVGPLSDAIGRRKPLIAGISLHILASVLCAFAPSVEVLTVGRVLQGLGNAAVAVVAMAMVRDVFVGSAAATLLSRLMLVSGMAPILAPSLGGAILRLTSWRGVFAVLAVAGVLLVT